jgi:hypothetical protein
MLVAMVGFVGIRGPLYKAAGVKPAGAYLKLGAFLHHIAAHLDHGTPLTADERRLVDEIHPRKDGKWPYDPSNVDLLVYSPQLHPSALDAHPWEIIRLSLSLAWRAPIVDLVHVKDNSAAIWRVCPAPPEYLRMWAGRLHDDKVWRLDPEKSGWLDGKWVYPLSEVSRPVPRVFVAAQDDQWSWLFWRPALYTYLLAFAAAVAAIRAGRWQFLLIAVPVALQTLAMAIYCPAPQFRYQWPAYLAGMLISGFLIWVVPRGGYGTACGSLRVVAHAAERDSQTSPSGEPCQCPA